MKLFRYSVVLGTFLGGSLLPLRAFAQQGAKGKAATHTQDSTQSDATAQEASSGDAKKKEKSPFEGLPRGGTLASTTSGITTTVGGFEPDSPKEEEPLALGGSITKGASRQWKAKVFNNTKYPVQVNATIVEYTIQRSVVRRTPLATTLRPKSSYERSFEASPTTTDASIELGSWKEIKK
jgi:hypothetical protein